MTDSVLIVGAGPVGLTLALELSRYGITVRLIDKMTTRSDKSRAVAIWSRSLELLERAGLNQELLDRGNKVRAANILARGRRVARLDFEEVDTPYPFALMIPQYDTEEILERHLKKFGVSTEIGVELLQFVQNDRGVETILRHADGRSEAASFSWIVGCDGAHSTIRHQLGLTFAGDTMPIDWALGDFHMKGSPFGLEELATYWHRDGFIVFFPMAPGRYRIVASLGPSSERDPVPPTLGVFQDIVDGRGPGGLVLTDSLWTTAFRINERQVASYRSGRVFLAGDAAHVHSPAGGQGMNTGIQDAVNLAWKLALICHGISDAPELLESYDSERRPVGAAVIKSAGRLSNMATMRNAGPQYVRNALFHVLMGLKPARRAMEETMTEISVGYPSSPLNGAPSRGKMAPGSRVAPIDGERPYGASSPRFCIRASSANEGLTTRFASLLEPTVRSCIQSGSIQLIRPDGYLAMSTKEHDWATVEDYLRRFTKIKSVRPLRMTPGEEAHLSDDDDRLRLSRLRDEHDRVV